MLIDHETDRDEWRLECDNCHRQWLFEGYELSLAPWPHGVCPACGQWIPAF